MGIQFINPVTCEIDELRLRMSVLCVVRVHVHISIHGLLNTHIAVTLCAGFPCCVTMDASEKNFNMFKLPNELEQSLQKNLNGIQ